MYVSEITNVYILSHIVICRKVVLSFPLPLKNIYVIILKCKNSLQIYISNLYYGNKIITNNSVCICFSPCLKSLRTRRQSCLLPFYYGTFWTKSLTYIFFKLLIRTFSTGGANSWFVPWCEGACMSSWPRIMPVCASGFCYRTGRSIRSRCDGSSDRSFTVDPLSYFSFQPVLHNWCNKGCDMCYPVCGMVHTKEPLLLIGKEYPVVAVGFLSRYLRGPLPLCLTPYNRK